MRILIADAISEDRLDHLREQGHDVVTEPALKSDELVDHVAGIDVLVVRSTKVSAAAIDAADRLGLIVRAGAGTDNIDVAAASARGIFICNVPGRNAVAVAELTMGLILSIDRRIPANVADLRAGQWNKGLYSQAAGLLGSKIALIGLGGIGLAVAERAKAFGITPMAARRSGRSAQVQARIRNTGVSLFDTDEELLADADIVSLHVPRSPETTALVNDQFLAMMKPGAMLVNTSRAEVVDEQALLRAIETTGLRVGLDVWPNEPSGKTGSYQSELAQHPQVIGTHHIGASTQQAQDSVAEGTIEVIESYTRGQVQHCVNLDQNALGTSCLTIRHLDRVGVLANVFGVLRRNGLNVQQVQNQIFSGADAAVATVYLSGHSSPELLDQLVAIDEVLAAAAVAVDGQ